jgi:hypothetical protein
MNFLRLAIAALPLFWFSRSSHQGRHIVNKASGFRGDVAIQRLEGLEIINNSGHYVAAHDFRLRAPI